MSILATVGTVITGVVLAGCSSPAQGVPSPTTAPSAGASATGGAPPIAHPIDTTKYQQDPCSVLTAAQLGDLNVGAQAKPTTSAFGPGCEWADSDGPSKTNIGMTLLTKLHGLNSLYAARRNYSYFIPTMIDGFPGVYAGGPDERNNGTCGLDVGVAPAMEFDVIVFVEHESPNYHNPCGVAQELAIGMVSTMKAGG
jgi:hypothetical protein